MKQLLAGAAALAFAATPLMAAEVGPTVQAIKDRGSLLCTGHNGSYLGFAEVDDKGEWSGFDIEFCKALATAILGSPDALQIIPVSWAQRFPALQSGDIDVIIKVTGWTMSRDTELGLQFSRPYFIGPTNILVRSELGATSAADLEGGVFCINAGTSIERIVADYMGARDIEYESLTFEKGEELRAALYAGRCDALAGFGPFL
ncbi:MAG: transporter substrate-binding domain-containing protein, partial [Pseudomonadota bacterium]